ncbi:hypothetical protein BDR26DRAFT_941046 [Obelidium mucronatum]|nr:hypothetical protein BDR26DRAFT_941046 [Obelidium mucronatum]
MIQGIAFVSPKTLQRKFTLPHTGVIHGMAIPKGITLIVGGGFHGKSTLMDALQMGVYNHIPGDGREFVVTESTVLKIRAEDGSTLDASGSTSMAANIQEALEYGLNTFRRYIISSCATNFLIRDQRMQQLISPEKEPITPLISKVRSLHQDLGCSSVLVVGGCGSYLDVADLVISMDSYVAKLSADKMDNESAPTYHTSQPPMFAKSASTKSAARRTHMITFSGIDVDLSGLEQLVHTSQSRLIVDALVYLREIAETQNGATAAFSLKEAVHRLEQVWDRDGLEAVGRFASTGGVVGDYARPRGIEVVAALNRIRGLASLG